MLVAAHATSIAKSEPDIKHLNTRLVETLDGEQLNITGGWTR